jgi:SAM-dependent methyltransferase
MIGAFMRKTQKVNSVEQKEQWDKAAKSWVEFVRSGKNYYAEYLSGPALKRMVGNVKGKRVLDIGCGEGYFLRFFAKAGAKVIGIDLSESLIKAAMEEEDFVALLTLMDNLIRDRKWLQQLFNYTFKVEYFQKKGMKWHVNILHNNEFLGFINLKVDRPKKLFIIKDLVLKRKLENDEWTRVLDRIKEFAKFHNAEAIIIRKTEPIEVQIALRKHGFSEGKNGELLFHLN